MTDSLPGLPLLLGGLVSPLLPAGARRAWLVALPLASLLHMLSLPAGTTVELALFGYALQPVRVDALSLVWGWVFHIAALLCALYSWRVDDRVQQLSASVYAGSAIAAVFAGDLITLFVFWELTAVSSVFLVWASRSERAYRAGMRYLIVQVGSGVLLLAGVLFRLSAPGSLAFDHLGLGTTGTNLIFLAFGVKCAFPLLHNWLQDSYPEATAGGAVVLSVYTTKLAVYGLARGFAGTESLVWIGATMTAFPIFFALIENDLRRLLAYSLNSQLGFMVVGVGIGSQLSLNGTAAHAVCSILYTALLFMATGAVLARTGTAECSKLGGLAASMPWTAGFCCVGAASISAAPLFAGFVSKSLIVSAAAEEHRTVVFLLLLVASAGTVLHSGIKVPLSAFFSHDSGRRVPEAPTHMLLAMGAAAALCVGIGVWPEPLYRLLPYPVDYHPYTTTHVVTQMQLLLSAALAFAVLKRTGLYPPELRSTVLDSDWLYRRALPRTVGAIARAIARVRALAVRTTLGALRLGLGATVPAVGADGWLQRTWSTGGSVLWVAALLGALLVVYYS